MINKAEKIDIILNRKIEYWLNKYADSCDLATELKPKMNPKQVDDILKLNGRIKSIMGLVGHTELTIGEGIIDYILDDNKQNLLAMIQRRLDIVNHLENTVSVFIELQESINKKIEKGDE